MKSGVNKLFKSTIFPVFVLLLSATLSYAQLPANMPDAAKPGAQSLNQEVFLYPELEPEPGKYIVPPVVDRPLGVGEGPRIKIEAIDLRGANDHPGKNLKVDEVWKIIEKNLRSNPAGLTIGELQEMANEITQFYRNEKGFVVAHAFLPVQTVEDGIITIQVLEGVLGRLLVEGTKRYKPEQLGVPFQDMIGKPLFKDEVESVLIRLGDMPGLTTFGVFQPGKNIGESDLVLKVQEEDGGDGVLSLDNHGSRFTGEYRYRFDLSINNMFGLADRLDLGFQKTADPSNSRLLSFDYSLQLFSPKYRLELGHSDSNFTIEPGDTGVDGLTGLSRELYLRLRNRVERSRLRNSHWLFSITRKTAKTFRDGARLSRDHLAVLGFEWGFDSLDAETQGLNNFVLQFSHGMGSFLGAMNAHDDQSSSRRGGSGEYAGARFDKLFLSYTRLQTLSKTTSLLFRTNYQYTSNVLVTLEQFAMGGPNSVRAYPASEITMDRGIFMSLEHIWNAPGFSDKPSWFGNKKWGEVLTVSTFFDWAYGERLDKLDAEDKTASLKGFGVASQLTVPGSFTLKASLANTVDGAPFATNERRPQVFVNFSTDLF